MKKQPSRAPSPTPTSFSGISNYRTESYRPLREKNAPALPQIDYRTISKVHFDELSKYLAVYLAKAAPNSRSTARQKLTRLTIQQFHELSTDVYDELIRRKNEQGVPYLLSRSDFHPKRNQARQKLATLPTSRFEDLSSDVYYELARRYPEFKEDPSGETSSYDDYPAPDFPNTSPPRATAGRTSGRTSAERPSDSGYGGSVSSRRPSEDRRRPSEDLTAGRRSEENYRRPEDAYAGRMSDDANTFTSRRKPSQDTTRRSEDRDFGKRPSGTLSMSGTSDSTSTANPAQSTTATSGMIIPTKSTIEEEYIEVPYGRDARESSSTTIDERERSREASGDSSRLTDGEPDSASDYPSPMSPTSPPAGLSGLSARLKGMEEEEDEGATSGAGARSGDDYYDKYGRSSAASDRSGGNAMGSRLGGRTSVVDDQEKIRRDYEYKIATMQTQITNLQRDLSDASERERKSKEGEATVKQMEGELDTLRKRAEEQSSAMRALQKELEDVREARRRDKEQDSLRVQQAEEESRIYRDRCERLEEELQTSHGNAANSELVEQLKTDMETLLTELDDLSRRNDELMTAKDSDLTVIRDLDAQLKDYKRKYEQAKTELRSVKATSQLFLQAPKFDDQPPVSADGGILDIHVTSFLTAIDSLLTAGRSNAPTRVLTPMKSVVNAVTAIIQDVQIYERKQHERAELDIDALRSLRERAEATLSNLVAASKTHATSSGMSPVSLLDAAASHVSVTVTEIGKMIFIRRATKAEQDQFSSTHPTPTSGSSATNGFSPSLRSVDEVRAMHQRKGSAASAASTSSRTTRFSETSSPLSSSRLYGDNRRRPPSENSSSEQTNSPPPIFDQQVMSDDSAQAETSEDAWAELKPYLEAQTESIVYAIQSVLSGVRSPTPAPTLNENLTQIITIVSSIVAVCNDNLPPASAAQGKETLRELSDHANKLSEVQALPEVSKESRQIMAKSSFAIANAMKSLMKL